MSTPLMRQWHMLRLLPRAPQKIATADLEAALATHGYDINRRSIQRDLIKLSQDFPLVCDDEHKPYGWSWAKNAKLVEIPGMDAHAALTFQLVEKQLGRALPRATLRHMAPYFERARAVLATLSRSGLRSWPDRVRVIPRAQPLLPAGGKQAALDAVYEALFRERKIRARYRGRSDEEAREVELNPLGLVLRGGSTYLVCTYWDYDDVRYLPLHRFTSAEVLEGEARRVSPQFRSLDAYLATGALGFMRSHKPLALKLRVSREVLTTLEETPLSEDQVITLGKEGAQVKATVADTVTLRGWLLSYGSLLEVLGPKKLRKEIAAHAQRMHSAYAG